METWTHPDGRTVDVHPDAKSTQKLLRKAGFRPPEKPAEKPKRRRSRRTTKKAADA